MVDPTPTRTAQSSEQFTFRDCILLAVAVSTLATTATWAQLRHVRAAKQAVIREDCAIVRSAASAYRHYTGASPRSEEDLVAAGYLVTLPREIASGGCTW
jgi:hypothetical protein